MSGYSKRRHSKWDNRDSETFREDFHDRDPSRRPRESFSPGRGSRRHDNRSKESTMTLDREGNCSRISPEQDDRRSRLSSRSPRKGWSRSHRISRSRSRSQSPAHNFRREPAVSDRSRNRSGASGQICRDFAAGRCRRGHSCNFLHQEAQLYDGRRPLGCSPPDDWDGRRRRTGSSKFSPDNINDSDTRKSAHICNDFLKGRCRRGDACRFMHNDSAAGVFEKVTDEEVYSNRDRENRSRDVRDRSRDIYPNHDHRSRDAYPDHDHRSRDTYHDQDHRSRDSYPDHGHGSRDAYPDIDHVSRDRYSGHDHGRKRMYTDRNHENDPQRRGEIQCKFFAAGNCRNGNHCRFSHQAQEVISPERSRDDKHDTDRNFEGSHGWDGPRWGDATNISAIPTVPGWEGNKSENKEVVTVSIQSDERGLNHKVEADKVWDGPSWTDASVPIVQEVHGNSEIKEVAKDLTGARPSDDSWSHDMLMKPTGDPPATSIDKSKILEKEDPLQWKTESNVPLMDHSTPRGIDIFSGEIEVSPRDVKQQTIFNSTAQTPSIPNIAFAANLQSTAGETSFEQHCHTGLLGEQIPSYKDNKPMSYHGARRDVFGDNNGSSIFQNEAITVPHEQGIFQSYENANVNPIPNMTPSRQSQMPVLLHAPQGEGMQELTHKPPSLDDKVTAEPHTISLSLSAPTPGCTAHSTVSNEQLAQLSHLTASLTQLLESRQQLSQLSSSVSNHGMPNLPDLEAPRPPVFGASVELNQAPVVLKQSDPSSNSIEQKNAINDGYNLNIQEHHKPLIPNFPDLEAPRPLVSGTNINLNQAPVVLTQYELSSNSIEQKNAINETSNEGFNLNFPEHHRPSKDEENGKNTGLKAADDGPFQNVGSDDGADDSKKMKDIKGVRPFKFALADFVKELLKPSWKDGQVNKEAYKMIVKKVVDKVMETLGPQVPQTKEKIDLYLSCSKPKIDKLVQAYVDKHKKG